MQFALVCIIEDNFQIQAPGGLYSEELITGGIFAFQIWGASIRGGFIHGGAYFRNFTVCLNDMFKEQQAKKPQGSCGQSCANSLQDKAE